MSSDSTFGQNDWLVDEMYQQYRENPSSVDPEWRELFERNGAPQTAGGDKNVSPAPSPAKAGDAKESREKTDPKVARTTGAPSQDGRQTKVDQAAAEAASKRSKVLPKPKQSPLQKIADVSVEPGERQLKGIYKTIAKNMDESLSSTLR